MKNYKRVKPYYSIKLEGKRTDATLASARYYIGECTETEYDCGNNVISEYKYTEEGITATCKQYKFNNINVTRQVNTFKNESDKTIKISMLSSMLVNEIDAEGSIPWYDSRRFLVHYCINAWMGEGQWRKGTLAELGLYRVADDLNSNSIKFRSIGSWSTSNYYPLIIIEDRELKKIWYFEIEASFNWYFEIGINGGKLYVEASTAVDTNDGWLLNLEPNEEYATTPAAFGVTDGGFDEAVRELLKYKRINSKVGFKGRIPVIFNDYMNCLWANPSDEKSIPLINAAAEVGAEIFCIDAGWHNHGNMSFSSGNGDWIPNDSRFGKYGFRGIIDYIRSKNMIAGVWLEIESCDCKAKAFETLNDCLLTRHGEIINDNMGFLDFRKEKTRKHIMNVFDSLYAIGVRYIKNDYNQTIGIGCDGGQNMALCESMRESIYAFYDFIDDVFKKYPDLIIENCGGGGLRSDGGILPHFHLQSISDQESYYNNPSIISGALACIAPEKAGIWSYPYPVSRVKYKDFPALFNTDEYKARMCDGEETVFNLVNGMFGVLYLSGHIEYCDERNLLLVKQGVSLYKQLVSGILKSYPIFLTEHINIGENGFTSFGLVNYEDDKIILGVWRINSDTDKMNIDLSKWTTDNSSLKMIYPDEKLIKTEYDFSNNILCVRLSKPCSARLFEVKIK